MKKIIAIAALIVLLMVAGFSNATLQETNIIDMSTLRTEIAGTVIAEIYGTIQAQYENNTIINTKATPEAVSSKSVTSGSGAGFYKPTEPIYAHMAKFIKQDKNYMLLKIGDNFDVTWTFQNVGAQDWTEEFYLRYYKGLPAKEGTVIFLPVVEKGEKISVKLNFQAPTTPGFYNSYWELINNDGVVLLDNIWVGIECH